jgi:hypothetical protein
LIKQRKDKIAAQAAALLAAKKLKNEKRLKKANY